VDFKINVDNKTKARFSEKEDEKSDVSPMFPAMKMNILQYNKMKE